MADVSIGTTLPALAASVADHRHPGKRPKSPKRTTDKKGRVIIEEDQQISLAEKIHDSMFASLATMVHSVFSALQAKPKEMFSTPNCFELFVRRRSPSPIVPG